MSVLSYPTRQKFDGLSLVIIDDEPWARSYLRDSLDFGRHKIWLCGEASNGIDGMAVCKLKKPDIVIVDIKMPGMDGLSMISSLKEIIPDTRFLITSGFDSFEYAQKAIRLGVEDFILKPIDDIELNTVLSKICIVCRTDKKKVNAYKEAKSEIAKVLSFQDANANVAEQTGTEVDNRRIAKAIALIRENYTEPLSVISVADKVFMSPSYFSSKFKQFAGVNFCRFVLSVRLEKAKQLLKNRDLKIKEISHLIGLENENYFSKVFRLYTGSTPEMYRDGDFPDKPV